MTRLRIIIVRMHTNDFRISRCTVQMPKRVQPIFN